MANTAPNAKTRQVMVGSVALGGGAPCVVQSMLNLPLADVEGTLSQISRLQEAGCEVVRIAVPHKADLDFFEEICKKSPLPVVADIHFSAELAIEAARRGAKPCRRCGLLGKISLLSPEYLLSVERRPTHSGPPDH